MRSTLFSDRTGREVPRPVAGNLARTPQIVPLSELVVARTQTAATSFGSSEFNEEAAVLFRRIRQVAGLSIHDTAFKLHTMPSVIDALEHGDFSALPPWPETVLIVSGFTALAGVDPRPVLAAIRDGLEAKIIDVAPQPASAIAMPSGRPAARPVPARAPAREPVPLRFQQARQAAIAGLDRARALTQGLAISTRDAVPLSLARFWQRRPPGRRTRQPSAKLSSFLPFPWPLRRPVLTSLLVTLPLALIISWGSGTTLEAAVSSLPRPVSNIFRTVEDYILKATAPRKDGLVWIEVSDPRARKTDKLQSPRR